MEPMEVPPALGSTPGGHQKGPVLAGNMLGTLGMLPSASVPGLACSWFVLLKESQLSSGLEFCEPVVIHMKLITGTCN